MLRTKRILNAARHEETNVIYKGTSKGLSVDFFSRNIIGQKRVEQCTQIIGRKKEREKERKKPCKPKMLHTAKLFVRIEQKMSFLEKQELKEFITAEQPLEKC